MNTALLLIFLSSFSAFVASDTTRYDFTLEYKGSCPNSHVGCKLAAGSQQIVTKISGTGNINYEVSRMIGSISRILFDMTPGPNNATFVASGNVTFGVHQTHENHVLFYKSFSNGVIGAPVHNLTTFGDVWQVTSGQGALEGAHGILTMNGYLSGPDDLTLFVVGIIWIGN